MGRSLSSVIRTVETLTAAGVVLWAPREGVNYSTPTGRMLAGIFTPLAECVCEPVHERAAATRLVGRNTGRPTRLTPAQAQQARRLPRRTRVHRRPRPRFSVSRATNHHALAAIEFIPMTTTGLPQAPLT